MDRAEKLLNRIRLMLENSTHCDQRLPQKLTDTMLSLLAFQSLISDDETLLDELDSLVASAIQTGISAGATLHADDIVRLRKSTAGLAEGRFRRGETKRKLYDDATRLSDELASVFPARRKRAAVVADKLSLRHRLTGKSALKPRTVESWIEEHETNR